MQYMVVFLADISKKYYLCRYNVTIKLADRWKTNTIGVTDEAINVDDIIETTNHFRAVDYIIQENDGKLTETYIKQLHFILKSGTSEERKEMFYYNGLRHWPHIKEYLPEEMSFSVNYLGANITQVGLNFSRPAAQILGQYYQFIRLGFQGYKEVQYNSLTIAKYIHDEIGKMAPFVNYSNEVVNPLFIWYLKPEYAKTAKWTLYDLQDKLSQHGWMVPAYTLPSKLEDYVVMRVVVRQGFSRDMADMLLGDIKNAIAELEKLDYPTPTRMAQDKNLPVESKIFNHGGRRHKK